MMNGTVVHQNELENGFEHREWWRWKVRAFAIHVPDRP